MNEDNLTEEDRAFVASLAKQIWKARREGALIGALYASCVLGTLYVAFVHYGPMHPVSALAFGGITVVGVEVYRKLIRVP